MEDFGEVSVLVLCWRVVIALKDVALCYVLFGCAHLLSEDGKVEFIKAAKALGR
jgi:hypothetical protein